MVTTATISDWYRDLPWIDRVDADIEKYCGAVSEPLFDLRAKLQEWRRDGVVIFESVISEALLDKYDNDLEWLVAHPTALQITLDVAGKNEPIAKYTTDQLLAMERLKFYGVHSYSDAGRSLCLNPVVCAFLWHIFQDRPAPMSTLTFHRGSEQMAHADFAYVHTQTALPQMAASWIPLEDVHIDAGPLAYYPGSHRLDTFGHYDFGDQQIIYRYGESAVEKVVDFGNWLVASIEKQGIEKRIFLPKRGDVLVWHAALVHEGLPIVDRTRTRKSLVTHYTSTRHFPTDHIKFGADRTPVKYENGGKGVVFAHPWVNLGIQIPSV